MTFGNRSPFGDYNPYPFYNFRRRVVRARKVGDRFSHVGRSRPTRALATRRLIAGQIFVPAEGNLSPGYAFAKRTLDLLGSAAALVIFGPVMLLMFGALLWTTKGRPLFFQTRVGYQGQQFRMLKFRTMRLDADAVRHEVENEHDGPIFKNRRDPRVTRLGRFLRTTSIDELPQLFNVLAGQMSLVGPRPPLPAEVACYAAWQRRRLAVKPGLTCLWQVSGRSEIGFEQWVRMDLWYLKHQSLWVDLALLARTPWSVLSRRGAY